MVQHFVILFKAPRFCGLSSQAFLRAPYLSVVIISDVRNFGGENQRHDVYIKLGEKDLTVIKLLNILRTLSWRMTILPVLSLVFLSPSR